MTKQPRTGQQLLKAYGSNACEDTTPMTDKEWDLYYEAEDKAREAQQDELKKAHRLTQLIAAPDPDSKTIYTELGTPCSPKWDEDWIKLVGQTETELGRRCCGAHAPDDEPCQLTSTSKNGRCRFHGGGLGSGAQKGNANARIHGLYSKRLQTCADHCPLWKTCPFAGGDIQALSEKKRPACAYEQQELDALRKLDASTHEIHVSLKERSLEDVRKAPYPMYAQLMMLRENLNMLQIMITRATKAVAAKGLTVESIQQTDTYYANNEKPSALMQAHRMLTREHRLTLNLYHSFVKQWGLPKYESA